MKRILSAVLAICILVLTIPCAIAEENYGENLCLGKYVFSNGYFSDDYNPQNAVDGNYGSTAACGTIEAKPIPGMGNYFAVDLGEEYSISRIIIRTRRDIDAMWGRVVEAVGVANKENLSDFIKVGEKRSGGEYGADLNVELEKPLKARYIVAIADSGLAEIEAYGAPYVATAEGEFADVSGDKNKTAVRLVTKLKLMEGVDNGEFGTVNLLTRAEAAAIVLKVLGITPGKYGNEFLDVSGDTQYAPDISAALQAGIISKADYFRPDDYITACEFYAMLLRVNGYIYDFIDVEWSKTIINLAQQSGLSKGVGESSSTVNRGEAALILYNLLSSKYMDVKFQSTNYTYEASDNTFMHDKYKMDLFEGIVTADGATSLESESGKVKNSVTVGGKTYNFDTENNKMLGKAVYYLVNYEDEELIDIWVNEKKTQTIELFAEDISKTSKNEIYASDETGKDKRYRIEKDAYFLKNGVAFADVDYDKMTPKYGSIVLTDYNNDGVYDVVDLREPEITAITIASVDEDTNEIIISGKDNYKRTINYDTARVYKDGVSSSLSALKANTLTYVYLSDSGKNVEFEITQERISGIVTSVSDDTIRIDGEEYELSEYFVDNFRKDIVIDKEYEFLINKRNQIEYVIKSNEFADSEQLVYIRKCGVSEDNETIVFDLYTENNKFVKLNTSNKFKLDGEKLSVEGFEALGKEHFVGHPAIINTNSQGELTKMITDSSEKLKERNINIVGSYPATAGFYNGHTLVLPTCHDTIVFSVPTDSKGLPKTESGYDRLYSITTLDKKFSKSRGDISSSKKCVFYGSGKNDLPIAGIMPTSYGDNANYAPISKFDNDIKLSLVVSAVNQAINDEDEIVYNIEGYDTITGVKRVVTTSPDLTGAVETFKIHNVDLYDDVPNDKKPQSDWMYDTRMLIRNKIDEYFVTPIDTIQKNDIIRYASYAGQKEISELEIVFRYEKLQDCGNKVFYSAGDLPWTIFSSFRLEKARVDLCDDGRIKFYANDTEENLSLSDFAGKLIVVDRNADAYSMDKAEGYVSGGEYVIIFTSAGDHYSIITFK